MVSRLAQRFKQGTITGCNFTLSALQKRAHA
ncbi:Uncharacterised protein [Vibrio cholerae]|nr:Uncharacterised protein [Vibrio cholerae]